MKDQDKTKQQLIAENDELRGRLAALEGVGPEPQRAEEELRKAVLEATIENLPFDFWAMGPDGRYTMQNATSKAHWGNRIGETPEEAAPDANILSLWLDSNRRAFAGEKVEAEVSITVHNERKVFNNVIAPIWEGRHVSGILGVNIDITEQKQAEAALRESEERFRKVFEEGPIGILLVGTDGRIQHANRRFCAMLGYAENEIIAMGLAGISHPDDWERDHPFVSRLWRGEISQYQVEKRYLRKDGQAVRTQLTVSLMHDAAGRPISNIGMIEDITERKRTEEALQQAHNELEQRVKERTAELTKANEDLAIFRKFAEASGQGFSMADLDGRLMYLNPTLCRMLGEERPEDRIGQHLSIYYSEESNRRGKQEIEPALQRDGHWQGELPMMSRQGKSIPTWQSSFVIRDDNGNPLRLAVVITDITERKAAEEALRLSEEQYRGVAEACPDAIVMSDLNGRVLFASQQTRNLLGLADSDELLGQSVFDFVLESDRGRLAANLLQLIQAGVRRNTEYTAVRKDGTTVPNETSSVVIRDAAGKPKAVMAVIRDITARKHAEEALERERQSLWRMLQASDHERQIISYEIHDGLAQYLAAASMQFQSHDALRENSPQAANRAYETAVELVRQAHSESRRLISEVRPPVIDEIGLETALSHLVHEQRRRGGPKIHFDSDVQFDRLPPILENAIYRIIQEALTNACKHSDSKEVKVSMTQDGQDVRLEVRDWGIGFDPESVKKGRFGLEGIRQRVRLLGGRLVIESRPGSGTMVQVMVPILENHPEG
jgi:PAS domain S-box-containing protein